MHEAEAKSAAVNRFSLSLVDNVDWYEELYQEAYLAALQGPSVTSLVEALRRVYNHGCCVMHNDASCPGCAAFEALKAWRGEE